MFKRNRTFRQPHGKIDRDGFGPKVCRATAVRKTALRLTLCVWPILSIGGPLNIVPIPIDDITIFVPVTAETGNTVPAFDANYIRDYQFAPKDSLTFPDGRTHQIPRITSPDGRPYIPYAQYLSNGCWDSGYFLPCPAGFPCQNRQPRCVQNVLVGDTISIGGRVSIPGGRFLLPGEITPDGFALAPMETNLDRTFFFSGSTYYAGWNNLFPNTVTFANIGVQTQGNYFAGLPSDGGAGPHPNCGVWGCVQVADRAVFILQGPLQQGVSANLVVTGWATGSLLQDTADLFTESSYANHPNDTSFSRSPTQQAIVNFINAFSVNVPTATGHSLGALTVTGLGNDGYLPNVVNIAPMFILSNEALKDKPWVNFTNYVWPGDRISQGRSFEVGPTRPLAGVDVIEVNPGTHLRDGFFSVLPPNVDRF